jgi:hypothetical protein
MRFPNDEEIGYIVYVILIWGFIFAMFLTIVAGISMIF